MAIEGPTEDVLGWVGLAVMPAGVVAGTEPPGYLSASGGGCAGLMEEEAGWKWGTTTTLGSAH